MEKSFFHVVLSYVSNIQFSAEFCAKAVCLNKISKFSVRKVLDFSFGPSQCLIFILFVSI